jgi:hypothetical protein
VYTPGGRLGAGSAARAATDINITENMAIAGTLVRMISPTSTRPRHAP